ncbi:MAG: FAD-binding oxidoreductase [Thalassospira sp.]|uniref:FAD-binding oxidoreductase n=1 Tax=Thalassospira sp. TaxID=1912094 RepID=UPI003A8C16C6
MDIFIGSEGVLGLVAEVTLKIWRRPAHTIESVVCFPTLGDGLDALRGVMQAGLRPTLLRLYDRGESERWGQDDLAKDKQSVLCMIEFAGRKLVADAEFAEAGAIFNQHGGTFIGESPIKDGNRYASSRIRMRMSTPVVSMTRLKFLRLGRKLKECTIPSGRKCPKCILPRI